MSSSANYDVIIAGGGPAGTSAAIQLASDGVRVLLVEEKIFPRAKLCGEFISPECLGHFKRLGVLDQMSSAGGTALSETVFYSRRGRSVVVPSEWFGSGETALGLSRSEMDRILLERAKATGVRVLEKAHASGIIRERGVVRGIYVKTRDIVEEYRALVIIDATGRARALARYASDLESSGRVPRQKTRPRFVAFKAHMLAAQVAPGACEIYFYRGGYGGLNGVEGEVSNLCFIVSADDVRRYSSDPETVMQQVVMKNARAKYTLAHAHPNTPWLSVSLDSFGPGTLTPAPGLITIGDAAAFIDPFTGSGMLLALESGQVAAEILSHHLRKANYGILSAEGLATLGQDYQTRYVRRFNSRLRWSGLLRRAAFVPRLAEAAMLFFGTSKRLRRKLARATRKQPGGEAKAATG